MSACLTAAPACTLPELSSAWEVLCSGLTDAEARLLVLAFSGRRLYVPTGSDRAAARIELLRAELGAELTAKLMALAGGAYIDVPSASLARARRRHLLIRRALREGAQAETIAALCELSDRQLRRIVNGA